MRNFTIIEIDRDYRTYTGSEIKEFDSLQEAEEYCIKESWTGYDYYVDIRQSKLNS